MAPETRSRLRGTLEGQLSMSDRLQMLEATLDLVDAGVAILDDDSNVLFWNRSAEALTGYPAKDVLARPCPTGLYTIDPERGAHGRSGSQPRFLSPAAARNGPERTLSLTQGSALRVEPDHAGDDEADPLASPTLVSLGHKLGHSVPGMLRRAAIVDPLGGPPGAALFFYPVEEVDALPRGESGDCIGIERSQADMEDRLDAAYHQWATGRMPLGLLWIAVDQAQGLRRTHGCDACEAMLHTVEHTLLRQMKPSEVMGRWGDNEYLVLAHERTPELLLEHARRLAGLARTADFRWWGDRVGLTVSVGVSQAKEGDTLQSLLSRARAAMRTAAYAGGNQVTEARER